MAKANAVSGELMIPPCMAICHLWCARLGIHANRRLLPPAHSFGRWMRIDSVRQRIFQRCRRWLAFSRVVGGSALRSCRPIISHR